METLRVIVTSVQGLPKRLHAPFMSNRPPHVEISLTTAFGAIMETKSSLPGKEEEGSHGCDVSFENSPPIDFEVPSLSVDHALKLVIRVMRRKHFRMHKIAEAVTSLNNCIKAEAVPVDLDGYVLLEAEDIWDKAAKMPRDSTEPTPVSTPRSLSLEKKSRYRGIINIQIVRMIAAAAPPPVLASSPITMDDLRQARNARIAMKGVVAIANRPYDPNSPPIAPIIDRLVLLSDDELEVYAAGVTGQQQRWADTVLISREKIQKAGTLSLSRLHLKYLLQAGPQGASKECEMVVLEGLLTLRPEALFRPVDMASRKVDGMQGMFTVPWKRHWFVMTDRKIMCFASDAPLTDKWRDRMNWFTRKACVGRCPASIPHCSSWHVPLTSMPFPPQEVRRLDEIASVTDVGDMDTHGQNLRGEEETRFSWKIDFKNGDYWVIRTADLEVFNEWTTILLVMLQARSPRQQQQQQQQQQQSPPPNTEILYAV